MTPLWRKHAGILVLAVGLALLLLHRDVADMAGIWWTVSTYNHMIFIPPIIGWLIWQRWPELKLLAPRAWWPGLIAVALSGMGWALGEASGISVLRHAAVIGLIPSLALTLLGPTIIRAILFPLFYLIFLIPLGEELVPQLQTITAQLCMVFLKMVGIPASIDGVFIKTPVGLFEVAEACSGVKFLVAMIAYSTLAANVCYKSWIRRLAFLAMAFVVPIIANGFRAFSTIWISELTGSVTFASSFDHVIYGWVFFAVVMIVVMAIGWRWFDRRVDEPWIPHIKPDGLPSGSVWGAGAVAVALIGSTFAGQHALASLGRKPMSHAVTLPEVAGWKRSAIVQSNPWTPRFDGADHFLKGQYVDGTGNLVDLVIALYGWQEEKREIVGYAQGAFDPRTNWSWMSETVAPKGGRADKILSPQGAREVASFYWIGGSLTGSPTQVKFDTLKSRLSGTDQAAAAILVSSEETPAHHSRPAIDAFLKALGPIDGLAKAMIVTARGPA